MPAKFLLQPYQRSIEEDHAQSISELSGIKSRHLDDISNSDITLVYSPPAVNEKSIAGPSSEVQKPNVEDQPYVYPVNSTNPNNGYPTKTPLAPRAEYTRRSRGHTYRRPSTASDRNDNISDKQKLSRYTRELFDTRREVAAAQAREKEIGKKIKELDPNGEAVEHTRECLESESSRSKFDVVCLIEAILILVGAFAARRQDLIQRLQAAEDALDSERKKRMIAEGQLVAVEKECKAPFVVPALLRAFLKLSEVEDTATPLHGDQ